MRYVWHDACSYGNKETLISYFENAEQSRRRQPLPGRSLMNNYPRPLLVSSSVAKSTLRLLDDQSFEVYQDLRRKHPAATKEDCCVILQGESPFVEPALYANIDEATISKAAMKTNDAAGPSGLDAFGWRHNLVSRNYGDAGRDLRTSIA